MDAVKLINELNKHPLVHSDIPMQMQLGIPYLEKSQGRLIMGFAPHREEYSDGMIEIYPKQYELKFIYPFQQVVYFSNLLYESDIDVSKPIHSIDAKWMINSGKDILNRLYDACSRVISFQEENGTVSDDCVAEYQQLYKETAKNLGLLDLYKSR